MLCARNRETSLTDRDLGRCPHLRWGMGSPCPFFCPKDPLSAGSWDGQPVETSKHHCYQSPFRGAAGRSTGVSVRARSPVSGPGLGSGGLWMGTTEELLGGHSDTWRQVTAWCRWSPAQREAASGPRGSVPLHILMSEAINCLSCKYSKCCACTGVTFIRAHPLLKKRRAEHLGTSCLAQSGRRWCPWEGRFGMCCRAMCYPDQGNLSAGKNSAREGKLLPLSPNNIWQCLSGFWQLSLNAAQL